MKDEFANQIDRVSDELINVITDRTKSSKQRNLASQKLYQRHASWVVQQIEKKVYNRDDVMDISQTVWLSILQPEKLDKNYQIKDGKFRAYLRKPILWAILKQIGKLPLTVNEAGEKVPALFVDIDECDVDQGLDDYLYQEVIENIIKPGLKYVDLKPRNAYVTSEHYAIFSTGPNIPEVASINGISESDAKKIYEHACAKSMADCSDKELSVYLPVEYRTVTDEQSVKSGGGRYMANLLNMSEGMFRKYLHIAKKGLLEIVKNDLDKIESGSTPVG